MGRQIFKEENLTYLGDGRTTTWLRHLKFSIPNFRFPFWEVVARRNKQYTSHKAAALFVDDELRDRIELRGYIKNSDFFEQLSHVRNNAELLVLHALRPYTYFPWEDDDTEFGLQENYQLELPGGQATGKVGSDVAILELIEEAGIGAAQVLCWTDAYPSPSANDGGTHIERYGLWYVLCTGKAHPPMDKKDPERFKEGIVGSDMVPVEQLASYRAHAAKNGIPIELWVHTASFGLQASLNEERYGFGD